MVNIFLTTAPVDRLFGLDMRTLTTALMVMISMFILFLALGYLLFEPVSKILEKRQLKVLTDIEEAEMAKKDATNLKAEYDNKMSELQKEVDEILADARKRALKRENDIIIEANQEANGIIEKARLEMQREREQMADDIRKEIVDVATLLASKFIETNMTEEKQRAMMQETFDSIGDETWQI